MSDEFLEHDADTPSARDVDEAYGSQFLGVADVGDKKIRTKILKVRKRDVKDRDTGTLKKKIIIFFENIDKPLILNVTNKNLLVEAFGKNPAGWQNATVGIYVDPDCDVWRPEKRRRAFACAASFCSDGKADPASGTGHQSVIRDRKRMERRRRPWDRSQHGEA